MKMKLQNNIDGQTNVWFDIRPKHRLDSILDNRAFLTEIIIFLANKSCSGTQNI